MPFGVWWTGWGTCLSSSFWKCKFTSGWLFDIVSGHIKYNSRWWQLKYFLFSPRSLGKWCNLTNIFQMDGLKPPTRIQCGHTLLYTSISIHRYSSPMPNYGWCTQCTLACFFGGANKKDTESLQLQVNNPWKMVVDRLPYCWLKILQHLGCRKPCNNHEVYFTQIRFNGIEPSTCLQNLSAKLGDLVGYLFISVDLLSKNPTKTR